MESYHGIGQEWRDEYLKGLYTNEFSEVTNYFINMFTNDTAVIVTGQDDTNIKDEIVHALQTMDEWFQEDNFK